MGGGWTHLVSGTCYTAGSRSLAARPTLVRQPSESQLRRLSFARFNVYGRAARLLPIQRRGSDPRLGSPFALTRS